MIVTNYLNNIQWQFGISNVRQISYSIGDAAEELCKAARDKKEAIPVRIYLGSGFKPDVVEYMRSEKGERQMKKEIE